MTRSNLRPDAATFLGRDQELAALEKLLATDGALITLTGPPGVGKTRLARQLGLRLLARGALDEIWFVDLAAARTAEDIRGAVLETSGLGGSAAAEPAPARSTARALIERGRLLFILDNLEQAIPAAAEVLDDWLGLEAVAVLVTSRERLRLGSETVVPLGPLPEADAARLLLERHPTAAAPDERALALDIARRLDGLPLAIELAAGRLGVLSLRQLSARLGRRFDVLRGAARDAPARHHTLQAALSWSWDLLDPAARRALAQAAVFAGGFALDAAEAVIDPGPSAGRSVLDLLEELVDKSLLYVVRDGDQEPRFDLYQSVLEYGLAELGAAGELEAAFLRHARHYAAQATAWAAGLDGPDVELCDARLRRELGNLHAACDRMAGRDPALVARCALGASPIYLAERSLADHLALLDRALAAADQAGDGALVAEVIVRRAEAHLLRWLGFEEVLPALERAEALAAAAGRGDLEAMAAGHRAYALAWAGRGEETPALFARARACARAAGAAVAEAYVLYWWSQWLISLGETEPDEILALSAAARQICRDAGVRWLEARVEWARGALLADLAHDAEAIESLDQGARLLEGIPDRRTHVILVWVRAGVLHLQDRLEEAEAEYRRALGDSQRAAMTAQCATSLCLLLCEQDRHREARELVPQAIDLAAEIAPTHRAVIHTRLVPLCALLGGPRPAPEPAVARIAAEIPRVAELVEIGRAAGDLADAERDFQTGAVASARTRLAAARDRVARAARAPSRVSTLELRNLVRWLGHEIERVAAGRYLGQPAEPEIVLGPGAAWFRRFDDSSVDLRKRHVARRVLDALATARLRSPGQAVSRDALVAAGWPGEDIAPAAAAQRLWVAICHLRKMGLQGVIQTVGDGYALAPEVSVIFREVP